MELQFKYILQIYIQVIQTIPFLIYSFIHLHINNY